jgi:hypothetical protein
MLHIPSGVGEYLWVSPSQLSIQYACPCTVKPDSSCVSSINQENISTCEECSKWQIGGNDKDCRYSYISLLYLTNSMDENPFHKGNSHSITQEIPYLSWTQELTIGSYSRPDKPSPHPHTITSLITILILSSHLCPHLATDQYCSDIPWVREQLLHCVLIIIKV